MIFVLGTGWQRKDESFLSLSCELLFLGKREISVPLPLKKGEGRVRVPSPVNEFGRTQKGGKNGQWFLLVSG